MQPHTLIAVGVLIGMITVGVPAFLFTRMRERSFQRLTEAYERVIAQADIRYESVMDRLHATKNLPPSKVDMGDIYEERRQEERERKLERKNGGAIAAATRSIGDIDRVQREMEAGMVSGKYAQPAVK